MSDVDNEAVKRVEFTVIHGDGFFPRQWKCKLHYMFFIHDNVAKLIHLHSSGR